jgi:hypothetical protein
MALSYQLPQKERHVRNIRSILITCAAVGAAAAGGAAIAGATTSGTTTSGSTTSTPAAHQAFTGPAHGTTAHEDAEKPVTGTAATKAKAAAVKAAGGGTATEVTTDFTANGYEVTVKKTDGSTVEIHLDKSFNAVDGPGGPGRGGAPSTPGA